jgi:hypothetical protein
MVDCGLPFVMPPALRAALAFLCLCACHHATAREIPVPDLVRSLGREKVELARNAYDSAPAEKKTWPADKPAPISWAEAGLRDDAELVLRDAYFDGGSLSFYFKDSTDRYFVFCSSSPMGSDGTGNVVRREQVFFVGVPHPTHKGGVAVAIGSPADEFLLSVLKHAKSKEPPIPEAPRAANWAALELCSEPMIHDLSAIAGAREKLGLGTVFAVQDASPAELRALSAEKLMAVLADQKNPLGANRPFTVVILLPLNGADDLLRLEGCAKPGDYYFSHATKASGEVQPSAARWACFTLPHPPVAGRSSGLSFSINSPRYRREAPAGYRFETIFSSATGRRFQ